MAFPHLQDPQFAIFTTESGILSTVEFFANCQYGYDVRCELVGSLGIGVHDQPDPVVHDHRRGTLAEPRPGRLARALRRRVHRRAPGLDHRPRSSGECVGPSAWEGYAATKVVEVGVEAVKTGARMTIDYIAKPALYR